MAENHQLRPKRITTRDIALASGLSRATVSYVLNNASGHSISETTRQHVLETAHRLGHVPNGPARSLRLGRSSIVLALVRDYTISYVADRLMARLDTALSELGYELLVHRYAESVRPVRDIIGLVSPDLVITLAGLEPLKLPTDSFVKHVPVQGMFPHGYAGELQVEYLVTKGHRKLGYADLDADRVGLIATDRFQGAERARLSYGLPPFRFRRLRLDDVDAIRSALDDWLTGKQPVTAVVAHNDETALALMSALRQRGLRPGIDLAVIGVDDIPLARIGVTTIRINVEAYAQMIVDEVSRVMADQPGVAPPAPEELLRLIVRDSA